MGTRAGAATADRGDRFTHFSFEPLAFAANDPPHRLRSGGAPRGSTTKVGAVHRAVSDGLNARRTNDAAAAAAADGIRAATWRNGDGCVASPNGFGIGERREGGGTRGRGSSDAPNKADMLRTFLRHVDREADRERALVSGADHGKTRPATARPAYARGRSVDAGSIGTIHADRPRAASAHGTRTTLPSGGAHVRRMAGARAAMNARGGGGDGGRARREADGKPSVSALYRMNQPRTTREWTRTLSPSRAARDGTASVGPSSRGGTPSGLGWCDDDGDEGDDLELATLRRRSVPVQRAVRPVSARPGASRGFVGEFSDGRPTSARPGMPDRPTSAAGGATWHVSGLPADAAGDEALWEEEEEEEAEEGEGGDEDAWAEGDAGGDGGGGGGGGGGGMNIAPAGIRTEDADVAAGRSNPEGSGADAARPPVSILGCHASTATPAYAATLMSDASHDASETRIPQAYHVYDADMPRGLSHGAVVSDNGELVFDEAAARDSVRHYRLFPAGESGGRVNGSIPGGGAEPPSVRRSGAWEAVQLAWTCDLMSADTLKSLDPLKLSPPPAEPPDANALLRYRPERGALRMWEEVYEKCLFEVERAIRSDGREACAATLGRLRTRTSRLFAFARRLLAAYRQRLSENAAGTKNDGGVDDVADVRRRLDEALEELAKERAARATAAARVVSLQAELAAYRNTVTVPST